MPARGQGVPRRRSRRRVARMRELHLGTGTVCVVVSLTTDRQRHPGGRHSRRARTRARWRWAVTAARSPTGTARSGIRPPRTRMAELAPRPAADCFELTRDRGIDRAANHHPRVHAGITSHSGQAQARLRLLATVPEVARCQGFKGARTGRGRLVVTSNSPSSYVKGHAYSQLDVARFRTVLERCAHLPNVALFEVVVRFRGRTGVVLGVERLDAHLPRTRSPNRMFLAIRNEQVMPWNRTCGSVVGNGGWWPDPSIWSLERHALSARLKRLVVLRVKQVVSKSGRSSIGWPGVLAPLRSELAMIAARDHSTCFD